MSFFGFHSAIEEWFQSRFSGPTEPQQQGWPAIAAGEHTLIAAPTGSGKTLAAFLACIDRLLKHSLGEGPAANDQLFPTSELPDGIRVVYVSPLRALSNDMHRNLEVPLKEITQQAESNGSPISPIRIGLRTGDTLPSQRAALVRRPPHILVTTPESLYLMLTSEKGRDALATTETIIVDEIHALVRDKRGSHLSLTIERLESLCGRRLQRIGLSATQKPIERVAEFLVGSQMNAETSEENHANETPCRIVDTGSSRDLDLAIETPVTELGAVCMHEQWEEVNARLVELIQTHRSTLIFVNTRRMAERVTHQLTELLGEGVVGSHHGSLSASIRLETERRLKEGQLKAVVATASLELGLDIGYIDLVVQLGSPRSIAAFVQRVGRSGHSLSLTPKGRLFALTRDELMESMAMIRAVRAGRLDSFPVPQAPLDVLAQHIVAEAACQEWPTDELFALFCKAQPYRNLQRQDFDRTIEYLSEGISKSSGRSRVYLHHDQVGRRIRARKGARIAATSNGGAIPEIATYRVITEEEGTIVGTLDEEFAVESMRGDVFLLGNTSWQIRHVRGGDVTVIDAHGAPPTIPFWRGEAPGRTLELSEEVSDLRYEIERRLDDSDDAVHWLKKETSASREAAEQLVEYTATQRTAIGLLPTQDRVIFERFFDETGGMQLVVHAPFGAAINRAWGLAMRKRFCRSFDFELQATADDEGFILSLGPQHSFPIESLFPMLTPQNARSLLEQAILTIPMFQVRWRWNVTRALLVMRMQNGRKVPPAFQRFRADDLLTAVFPKLTGCQEEHTGDHELPDHPLTQQTMEDCLREALDIDGLLVVLERIQKGEIQLIARDTREPSPFSHELLNANPYAFLDGGEAQERRARAVATRRSMSVDDVGDLALLDTDAIRRVRNEARPMIRDEDELHDVLLGRIVLPLGTPETEMKTGSADDLADHIAEASWQRWFQNLADVGRATTLTLPDDRTAWVAAERLPAALAAFPESIVAPAIEVPLSVQQKWAASEARTAIIRGLVEVSGPTTAAEIAALYTFTESQTAASLEALEGEGIVLRGQFRPETTKQKREAERQDSGSNINTMVEWCHRRLLARIHRLTIRGLREQIEPVDIATYFRFLTRHQGFHGSNLRSGPNGLFEVLQILQGLDLPAICWERDVLAARLQNYSPTWMDELSLTGEVGWGRLFPPKPSLRRSRPMKSLTRNAPVSLWLRDDLSWLTENRPDVETDFLSENAKAIFGHLQHQGATFAAELLGELSLMPFELNDAIGELVSQGVVTADGFGGLRQLIDVKNRPSRSSSRRRTARGQLRQRSLPGHTGRWSVWSFPEMKAEKVLERSKKQEQKLERRQSNEESVEQWAWQLLRRWGVVFRDLLAQETLAPRWFELLQAYRRMEARGEIRGGRFIKGVAGEQFALPDSVNQLRQMKPDGRAKQTATMNPFSRTAHSDHNTDPEVVVVSAVDPLNLTGVLEKTQRVPATTNNRVLYAQGEPVAALIGGELQVLAEVPENIRSLVTGLRSLHCGAVESSFTESHKRDNSDSDKSVPSQKAPAGR